MSIKNWPGGYIKPIPPTPAGPFQDGAAPGVWTLDQVAYWLQQGLWPIAGNVLPIALFGPGSGDNTSNVISKLVVSTLGNATDFGDYALNLGQGPLYTSAFGSSTRCIWSGGQLGGSSINNISYSTYATAGNAADFGDLTVARYDTCGMSNSVRGVTAGGYAADRSNVIDYVTVASTGNAVDFGDASGGFYNSPAGLGSSTRGVFALGYGGPSNARTNIIEYITIASTGNSTDFGDLSLVRNQVCGASNNATGIWCGGRDNTGTEVNVMDYVTISSIGNATDFGDLTQNVARAAATASSTRLVRGGGSPTTNVIDYVEISTAGNATDFGDLVAPGYTGARFGLSAACAGAASVQA